MLPDKTTFAYKRVLVLHIYSDMCVNVILIIILLLQIIHDKLCTISKSFIPLHGFAHSPFTLQMVPFWPKETSSQMVVKAESNEQPNVTFSYAETSSFLLPTVILLKISVMLRNDCILFICPHSHQL